MKKNKLSLHTSFTIAPVDERIFGGFLEHMGRAVYEGVYDPKSSHADETGCRTDVLAALKRLKFTAMRYPGGNFVSGYHWMDGVGPKDKRPTTRDLAWQSLESNHFGTDEFLALSEQMGWTPMVSVNLGTGSPEEARNWLEYCNMPGGSRYADMRIANGRKDPYGVKLWCLGNEMDGQWQIGHVPAEVYAINAQQAANMMKMCDPEIELVLCGSCGVWQSTYLEWDRKVLEHCGDFIDYISVHRYVGNETTDTSDYLAITNAIDKQIEETAAVCAAVQATKKTKKKIGISFDEWNVWYRFNKAEHMDGKGKFAPHLIEEVYNLEDALVVVGFLNSFIRHADTVKIANLAQIVNVIAPILTKGNEMLIQSIFYPIEMIASRGKGTALQGRVSGDSYESKSYGKSFFLDQSAILDEGKLHLCLVNRHPSEEMEVEVDLSGAKVSRLESAEIVQGNNAESHNTYEDPNQVVSKEFKECKITESGVTVKLPPLSVYSATFKLA